MLTITSLQLAKYVYALVPLPYNNVVSSLNEAKTLTFQPTVNFEIFDIYLYFICQSASLPACLP